MTPPRPARSRWSSTWIRVTALAAAVLAAALASTVLVAWRLATVQGQEDLDDVLLRERDVLAATAPGLLDGVSPTARDEIVERLSSYLGTQPGSDRHLSVITVAGAAPLVTGGPAPVATLLRRGDLPVGTPGRVVTLDTAEGPLRVLTVPIEVRGTVVGQLAVYGWLGGVERDAATVARVGTLAAAGVAVLGTLVLAVALRAATAPLRSLRSAADRAGVADLGFRIPDPEARQDDVADLSRAFNRMLQRLEREVEARGALFASVSHELRTPVAVARGHLELVSSGTARDPAASLRLVHAELGRLSRLLDDLLLLAAARGDGSWLAPRRVTRGWLADEVAVRLDGLRMGDLPVTVAPGAEAAGTVLVDPDRMIQAAVNLAVNVRRHTPAGTPAEVLVGGAGPALTVTVRDEGPGIPEELRERILDPFVGRGGRGSTGLGLAVVKAVAEAHGGGVDLATGPGGTVVAVAVPGEVPGTAPVTR
ncbi:MAG: ATP-binding protein [Kineosporiaceae bacterium]